MYKMHLYQLMILCVSIFAWDREMWTHYLLCSLRCIQNIMDASIPRSVSSCSSAGKSHTEGQLFQKQLMSEVQTNSCRYGSDFRRYWNRHQRRYLLSFRCPYDLYCPTPQLKDIRSRICRSCNIYMPSAAAVNRHRQQNLRVTTEHSASKIFAPTSDDTKDCATTCWWWRRFVRNRRYDKPERSPAGLSQHIWRFKVTLERLVKLCVYSLKLRQTTFFVLIGC